MHNRTILFVFLFQVDNSFWNRHIVWNVIMIVMFKWILYCWVLFLLTYINNCSWNMYILYYYKAFIFIHTWYTTLCMIHFSSIKDCNFLFCYRNLEKTSQRLHFKENFFHFLVSLRSILYSPRNTKKSSMKTNTNIWWIVRTCFPTLCRITFQISGGCGYFIEP